jgi:hypothetical protein
MRIALIVTYKVEVVPIGRKRQADVIRLAGRQDFHIARIRHLTQMKRTHLSIHSRIGCGMVFKITP